MTKPIDEAFELVSLTPSVAPVGGEGENWFEYRISQGPNVITGYRQGSTKSVKEAVQEIVAQLNERRVGKPGRVHLTRSVRPESSTKDAT